MDKSRFAEAQALHGQVSLWASRLSCFSVARSVNKGTPTSAEGNLTLQVQEDAVDMTRIADFCSVL